MAKNGPVVSIHYPYEEVPEGVQLTALRAAKKFIENLDKKRYLLETLEISFTFTDTYPREVTDIWFRATLTEPIEGVGKIVAGSVSEKNCTPEKMADKLLENIKRVCLSKSKQTAEAMEEIVRAIATTP